MQLLNDTKLIIFIIIKLPNILLFQIITNHKWKITSTTTNQLLLGVSGFSCDKTVFCSFTISSIVKADNVEKVEHVPALVEHIYRKNRTDFICWLFQGI